MMALSIKCKVILRVLSRYTGTDKAEIPPLLQAVKVMEHDFLALLNDNVYGSQHLQINEKHCITPPSKKTIGWLEKLFFMRTE
jgi:hypothetical protein